MARTTTLSWKTTSWSDDRYSGLVRYSKPGSSTITFSAPLLKAACKACVASSRVGVKSVTRTVRAKDIRTAEISKSVARSFFMVR